MTPKTFSHQVSGGLDNNTNNDHQFLPPPLSAIAQFQHLTHTLDFHVALALSKNKSEIMAGVVFEYYRENNCACITYLLVSANFRKRGMKTQSD